MIISLWGIVLLALVLLFPHWVARDGDGTLDLGDAWVGTPPARVGPDHSHSLDVPSSLSEADRRRTQEYLAASFGVPEIDWLMVCIYGGVLLCIFAAGVFAARDASKFGVGAGHSSRNSRRIPFEERRRQGH